MKKRSKKIKILIKVQGGFGTVLIRANYVYCLYQYLDDERIQIDVIGHKSDEMNDAIFSGVTGISAYYPEDCWDQKKKEKYHLVFVLDLYPCIESCEDRICKLNCRLTRLIQEWRKLRRDSSYSEYFRNIREAKPYEFRKLIDKNKTVLNSADISGELDIGNAYSMPVQIWKNGDSVLNRFGLEKGQYITVQRGINPKLGTTESPKMWSKLNYEGLIRIIKEHYPEYKIVQLGESLSHCKALSGIDISAVGKTDWDDLKVLLKYAKLHIDGECGMVHLRKALNGGPSVVLFGITPKEFFGYDGNINISGDGCPTFCAEIADGWEYRCVRGFDEAPCMESIKPEMVFEKIERFFEGDLTVLDKRDGKNFWTKNYEEIMEKYGGMIDKEYAEEWFNKQHIFFYELTEVNVSQLKATVYQGAGEWRLIDIVDTPAYAYVVGEKDIYKRNMMLREKELSDNVHSLKRYDELLCSLEKRDKKVLIIVDEQNIIKDGQHRAAWFMAKNGENSRIPALKVYLQHDNLETI